MRHLNENFSSLVMQLTELGMTKYEALTYLAVVANGESSAKQISQLTGVPYGKVYEVINTLIRKGFLHATTTKPLRCSIITPKESFSNIKTKMIKRIDNVEELLFRELGPHLNNKKKDKNVSIIEGSNNIYKKILEIYEDNSELYLCGHIKILKKILSQIDNISKDGRKKATTIILKGKEDTPEEINAIKNKIKELFKCTIKTVPSTNELCILSNTKDCLII